MLKTIAFIDDDAIGSRFYVDELGAKGYNVKQFRSVDGFLADFRSGVRFDLYILDLMMSGGRTYSPDKTDEGATTGVYLAQDICESHPGAPILVISNANVDNVLTQARKSCSKIDNTLFLRKAAVPPSSLCDLVTRILKSGIKSVRRKGIVSKLAGILVLRPSIYGIGIDLKKLRADQEGQQ